MKKTFLVAMILLATNAVASEVPEQLPTETVSEISFVWHELPIDDLKKQCLRAVAGDMTVKQRMKHNLNSTIWGCQIEVDGKYHIYTTRKEDMSSECMYMETIGHEVRHIRDGAFHGGSHYKRDSYCVNKKTSESNIDE